VALIAILQGVDPERVYALQGGLAAWQAAGYPMSRGEAPGRVGQ
jgi:3-mercaptopyruvate sulfurtransferase SseA